MKKLPLWFFALLLFTAGCTQPLIKKINVQEAQSLMKTEAGRLQIVDLRTPGEIEATGTLPGAAIMDFTSPAFLNKTGKLDKSRPVLLYCASGGRSAEAAEQLNQAGFELVYDMSPGMSGWMAATGSRSQ